MHSRKYGTFLGHMDNTDIFVLCTGPGVCLQTNASASQKATIKGTCKSNVVLYVALHSDTSNRKKNMNVLL
jgi:hypothetical protein